MATHIAELQAFSVKEQKNRARELGAPAQAIDDLDDAADVKTAAIQLVIRHDKDLPDDQREELMKLSIKEPAPATEKKVEPRNTETAGLVPACLITHTLTGVSHIHPFSHAQGTEEWGNTFGCLEDVAVCFYVGCCFPCSLCDMGSMIGPEVTIGKKKEPAPIFLGCGAQCLNWLSYDLDLCGPCVAAVACPDKCMCFYDINILKAAAVKLNKDSISPGPCEEPCLQVFCCKGCTYCLVYRELKKSAASKSTYGQPEVAEMAR